MLLEHGIYLNVVRDILNHRNSESALGIASDGPQIPSCVGAVMVAFCFLAGGTTFVFEGQDQREVTGGEGKRGHCRNLLGWLADP